MPDFLCLPAFGEEQKIRFDTRAGCGENAGGQADDAPKVAIVEQFSLGLDERVFIRAE